MKNKLTKTKLYSLYLGIFVLAVSEAIIAYVQSTYLNQYFNLEFVSFIFIFSYILTFLAINEYSNFIARFNNYQTAVAALLMKCLSLLIFIFSSNPGLIFFGFILFTVSFNLIFINFDIFLESFTSNTKTGSIRGKYFTIYNLGWIFSPFLSGKIIDLMGFNWLFSLDLLLTVLTVIILYYGFKGITNHYISRHFEMKKTLNEILRRKNIKKIFYVSMILHFFYCIMVIYTPIYLNQYIGLNWEQIGLIFTFMLLPFVFLQYPAGYIADKYIGEKEILTAGLIIMSVSSVLIFALNVQSIWLWGIVLFFSRIGASLTEIMRETYFFKKVDVKDIELINALRSTNPLAYIIAPFIVGVLLYFAPLNYVFLMLGLVILTALYPTLTLKDTK